jgi:hypothetical protein
MAVSKGSVMTGTDSTTAPSAAHEAAPVDLAVVGARARRLQSALHDLGLAAVVPVGWARVGASGIEFAALGGATADRFVRALEDLGALLAAAEAAARRSGAVPTGSSVPGRPSWGSSTVHLEPPR